MSVLKGTDLARLAGSKQAADAIDAMKEQVLILLVERAGGSITLSADEIDGTDDLLLLLSCDAPARTFTFEVKRKS